MNAYTKVVNDVKKVNRQAALWLARRAPRHREQINLCIPRLSESLSGIMCWSATPQGRDYWDSICCEIEGI